MKKKETTPTIPPASPDYTELVNLLAVLTEASNQLTDLSNTANEGLIEILDDVRGDYARLQETVSKTERALETIARRHPEWFADEGSKTIKTPYGTVSFRTSESLEFENEEAVLVRISLEAFKRHPGDSDAAIAARTKFIAQYVRTHQAVNKETLSAEDDAFLSILGIKRAPKENFSAKPARLDLGKAVKDSQKEAA